MAGAFWKVQPVPIVVPAVAVSAGACAAKKTPLGTSGGLRESSVPRLLLNEGQGVYVHGGGNSVREIAARVDRAEGADGGRQTSVVVAGVVRCQAELPQIVVGLCPRRRLAHLLHCGHQQGDQNRN